MVLRLTRTTAELVGESPAEWELLEKQVRAGRWTSGARAEAGRLRQLVAELGVAVRVEEVGVVPCNALVRFELRTGGCYRVLRRSAGIVNPRSFETLP